MPRAEHDQELGKIETGLRWAFSPEFRRAKAELEAEQREAVHAAVRDVIDGYAEQWGESRAAAGVVEFEGTAEGTTVAVNGIKTEQGGLGTNRTVHAQVGDGQYLSLRLHEPARRGGAVRSAELRYALTPTGSHPNWVNTPPSRDFAALVKAIWPTIDLESQMPRPSRTDRRMVASRIARANQVVGRT